MRIAEEADTRLNETVECAKRYWSGGRRGAPRCLNSDEVRSSSRPIREQASERRTRGTSSILPTIGPAIPRDSGTRLSRLTNRPGISRDRLLFTVASSSNLHLSLGSVVSPNSKFLYLRDNETATVARSPRGSYREMRLLSR